MRENLNERNLVEAQDMSTSGIDQNRRSPAFYQKRNEYETKRQEKQKAIDEGSPIRDMEGYNALCEAAKGKSTHVTHSDVEKKVDDARKESPVKVNPDIELTRKREEERSRQLELEKKRIEYIQEQRRLRREKEEASRANQSFTLFSPCYLARTKSSTAIVGSTTPTKIQHSSKLSLTNTNVTTYVNQSL